jgi:hypothetical protein
MKQNLTIAALAAGMAFSATTSQATLNFAGINNAQFNAIGDTFQLNPIAGSALTPQFGFTNPDTGLTGWITGAPWSVNMGGLSSTTVGSITYQQAPILGGGQLNIYDGVNTLTGNVSWGQIHILSDGQGGIADALSVNLTGMAYTGANADLLALAANPNNGNLNLTFQFSGTDPTLTGLFAGSGTQSVSYSGSISSVSTAVPEPSTVVAGALLLLPFGVSTVRILRKHKQTTEA